MLKAELRKIEPRKRADALLAKVWQFQEVGQETEIGIWRQTCQTGANSGVGVGPPRTRFS